MPIPPSCYEYKHSSITIFILIPSWIFLFKWFSHFFFRILLLSYRFSIVLIFSFNIWSRNITMRFSFSTKLFPQHSSLSISCVFVTFPFLVLYLVCGLPFAFGSGPDGLLRACMTLIFAPIRQAAYALHHQPL
ncbi:Uncharacterised protein [Streptococcus pneumoniae]|nr:Uncharacterised protein [Streptococcus pneumoniae]